MKKYIAVLVLLAAGAGVVGGQGVEASRFTKEKNEAVRRGLMPDNGRDFEEARRGFIATLESGVVQNTDGSVSFSMKAWDFLNGENPGTANPSLWRQCQLNSIHGLFEVVAGKVYQIRGFDLANMSFVRTESGWVVIDPLGAEATARAGYELIKKHVEKGANFPVKAVIVTHPHHDHYNGIRGILESAPNRDIQIIAPKGFFESAVNENVMAGPAMQRRGLYMYGMMLPFAADGNIGSGLGQTNSTGPRMLAPPTVEIERPLQDMSVDGLEMRFLFVRDAEAPVEIMVYFPQLKAFCSAEIINRLLHNLVTLRGAKVRNGQAWSKAIDRALVLCGDEVECSFSTHNWPMWEKRRIVKYWETQRDMYRYLHDQTLRLANQGCTPQEIAETVKLPDAVAGEFYSKEYYGTVSHNVKSQYELYFGWFDGNPANLNPLPPVEAGKKYVEAIGGESRVLELARTAFDAGDYRWGAMLLNHLVFANPANAEGRRLLADIYTQMGYQSENGPWRNFYLSGARELRKPTAEKIKARLVQKFSISDFANMTPEVLFDFLGIRIDGGQTAAGQIVLNVVFTDQTPAENTLILSNGALTNRIGKLDRNPAATIRSTKMDFVECLLNPPALEKMISEGKVVVDGDRSALEKFITRVDFRNEFFNIIEP